MADRKVMVGGGVALVLIILVITLIALSLQKLQSDEGENKTMLDLITLN